MRITVGKKLGLGFGTSLALVILTAILAFPQLESVRRNQETIRSIRIPTMTIARDLRGDVNQTQNNGRQVILAGRDLRSREVARAAYEQAWASVGEDIVGFDQLAPRWVHQSNRDRLEQFKKQLSILRREQEAAMNIAGSRTRDSVFRAGEEFTQRATRTADDIRKLAQETSDTSNSLLFEQLDALESGSAVLMWTVGLSTLLALVTGLLVATYLGKAISRGATLALERAEAIAQGDLTGDEIVISSRDELGQLAVAINKMQTSMKRIIESIDTNTQQLASASEELSATAGEQSASAGTQTDQTNQVATAMQEMSATVAQISESSMKAAEAARKASSTAQHGGKVVEDTLDKMKDIAHSVGDTAKRVEALGKRSDQIGQITGVIDDIADQTNLLALNAAIEAARAGEQGRGFAVVADEVRKLAERTSKATKEIAGMIRSIQEETRSAVAAMEGGTQQVRAGVETTMQAGSSLKEIIHSAEEVGEMVTQIASAATEQSAATEEINASIAQIAKITSGSSESAQESAKACHELSTLALDLKNLVSQFKLDGRGMNTVSRAKLGTKGAHPSGPPRKNGQSELAANRASREWAREEVSVAAR
jgi:methyl-accepting chemotaxis protein